MGNTPNNGSTPAQEQLYLGIDGGGTKCRARIISASGQMLGTGVGGPANPLHGVQQTLISIQTATERALTDAGLPITSCNQLIAGIGLAGVNLPSLFDVINQWKHPFKSMHLSTDLHIACLGAHDGADGAVIVAGTGSCGYSFVNGKDTTLGAHGFPFGDIGSGAWMGLEAVKAVLLASDDLGPQTLLSEMIGDHLQAKGVMIVDKMAGAKSSDYAQLAIFVLDAADREDAVALAIVKQGADYLSAVAERLWETKPGRMSLLGGVAQRMIPWMSPAVVERLSAPLNQPEFGAVYFAQQMNDALQTA